MKNGVGNRKIIISSETLTFQAAKIDGMKPAIISTKCNKNFSSDDGIVCSTERRDPRTSNVCLKMGRENSNIHFM